MLGELGKEGEMSGKVGGGEGVRCLESCFICKADQGGSNLGAEGTSGDAM